jgi:hypothetical protein
MKKLLLFMAPALLLAGCAREPAPSDAPEVRDETPILTSDELKFLSMVGRDTKFDQRNIDRIVGDVVGFMESTPATRSAGTRSVAEIRPLSVSVPTSYATTRSGDEEAPDETQEELFYLVNFDDDQGYSIIAADSRIRDEIALFVGHGNLDETEVENPGLAIMLSRLDDYAARSIAEYEAWCDSVEVTMMARIAEDYAELADEIAAYLDSLEQSDPSTRSDDLIPTDPDEEFVIVDTDYSYGPWTVQTQVEPMIPVEWGQHGVFNDRVEQETSPDYAAGCVAIATIQLMSYWKWPTVFHGVTMNWDTAIQYTGSAGNRAGAYKTWSGPMSSAHIAIRNAVADYIWYIGEDVDMNWGLSSGASSADAIDRLENLGYTVSSKQNYNSIAARASILAERPVYMRGNSHVSVSGYPPQIEYSEGHAWLIDGYLKQQQAITVTYTWYPTSMLVQTRANVLMPQPYTTTETYDVNREYFHNNFGWNGDDNGYYVPGIFDASDDYDDDLPSNTRSGEDYNYQFNLEMWTNIHN